MAGQTILIQKLTLLRRARPTGHEAKSRRHPSPQRNPIG
jgi:hypothetical protein